MWDDPHSLNAMIWLLWLFLWICALFGVALHVMDAWEDRRDGSAEFFRDLARERRRREGQSLIAERRRRRRSIR